MCVCIYTHVQRVRELHFNLKWKYGHLILKNFAALNTKGNLFFFPFYFALCFSSSFSFSLSRLPCFCSLSVDFTLRHEQPLDKIAVISVNAATVSIIYNWNLLNRLICKFLWCRVYVCCARITMHWYARPKLISPQSQTKQRNYARFVFPFFIYIYIFTNRTAHTTTISQGRVSLRLFFLIRWRFCFSKQNKNIKCLAARKLTENAQLLFVLSSRKRKLL